MSWIRVEQSIWTHRKTLLLAELLRIDVEKAAAKVIKLWHWAVDNCPTGDLSNCSPALIEIATQWTGKRGAFYQALIDAGFVDIGQHGTRLLHDWEDHNGRLLRRAEAERERVRKWREQYLYSTRTERVQNANRTRTVREQRDDDTRTERVQNADDTQTDTRTEREPYVCTVPNRTMYVCNKSEVSTYPPTPQTDENTELTADSDSSCIESYGEEEADIPEVATLYCELFRGGSKPSRRDIELARMWERDMPGWDSQRASQTLRDWATDRWPPWKRANPGKRAPSLRYFEGVIQDALSDPDDNGDTPEIRELKRRTLEHMRKQGLIP